MSMDDVTLYMAKREKSTLTAPNPEGSPIGSGLASLLTHPSSSSVPVTNVGAAGTVVNRISPPNSVPTTPQHFFQRATPQGSLSHLPMVQSQNALASNSANPSPLVGATSAAPSGAAPLSVRGESPPIVGTTGNSYNNSPSHNNAAHAATLNASSTENMNVNANANPTSSSQFRHISDIARIIIRNQHAAHSDPTSVANNLSIAADMNNLAMSLAPKKGFQYETGDTGLINFLCSVPHLYMISNADIRELSKNILRREYDLHDTILVNKQRVGHVYIVLKGRVEAYSVSQLQWDPRSQRVEDMVTHHERIGTIEVANMFCIDSVVFSEPSEFLYCAGEEKTLLGLIPAPLFLSILNRNVAMRQSIGRKLADHMDIFICFKDFCRHIFSHETAKHEYLPLWQILHAYERLDNCIHTKRASQEIDTDAWNYAIKRLPENLTTTFVFDLVRALPPFLTTRMKDLAKSPANAIGDVRYIVTKERRRCSWQLGMEGKTLVLLRDGFTDLLDFITCLCIHIIESNKLRGRLQGMVSPPAVDILDAKLNDIAQRQEAFLRAGSLNNGAASSPLVANATFTGTNAGGGVDAKDIRECLSRMPLSERERTGLHRNWGESCLRNIYSVMMHREEYLLRVDVSASRQFMTDPFHEWSLNLRKKLMLAMKLNPQGHLPDDLIIDIISSNTHSTKSLLSPFPRVHREGILAHAKEKKPDLFNLPWAVQEDLVYANCRNYMDATGKSKEFNDCLKRCGFEILEDTAMTGLQVDIVPVNGLDMSLIDPLLATRNCAAAGPRHFILNMDFAFGAQADGITATLVDTFGKYIRSFNVMGKAGGIASSMRRGDIQLASHVLLSKSSLTTEDYLDELRSCGNLDLTTDFVQSLCGQNTKIQVFNGPVLTIPGTMLQNDKLLLYYRHIWHCVGVEMEGSYFARQLKENIKAKLLKESVITRFAYYTSDMPLHSLQGDASLSAPMKPSEGTPPLYAIARALLIRILGGTDAPQRPELDDICGPSETIREQLAHQQQLMSMGMGGGGGGGGFGCTNGSRVNIGSASEFVMENGGITYAPTASNGSGGSSTPPLMRDMSIHLERGHHPLQHRHNNFRNAVGLGNSATFGSGGPPNPNFATRANSISMPHSTSENNNTTINASNTNNTTPFAKLPPSAATTASSRLPPSHLTAAAAFHNSLRLNEQMSPTTASSNNNKGGNNNRFASPEMIEVSNAPSPKGRDEEEDAQSSEEEVDSPATVPPNDTRRPTTAEGSFAAVSGGTHASITSPASPAETAAPPTTGGGPASASHSNLSSNASGEDEGKLQKKKKLSSPAAAKGNSAEGLVGIDDRSLEAAIAYVESEEGSSSPTYGSLSPKKFSTPTASGGVKKTPEKIISAIPTATASSARASPPKKSATATATTTTTSSATTKRSTK